MLSLVKYDLVQLHVVKRLLQINGNKWTRVDLIKILFRFGILHSYALLRVTFCVVITVSRIKGSTVFSNLELHVLRRENRA